MRKSSIDRKPKPIDSNRTLTIKENESTQTKKKNKTYDKKNLKLAEPISFETKLKNQTQSHETSGMTNCRSHLIRKNSMLFENKALKKILTILPRSFYQIYNIGHAKTSTNFRSKVKNTPFSLNSKKKMNTSVKFSAKDICVEEMVDFKDPDDSKSESQKN